MSADDRCSTADGRVWPGEMVAVRPQGRDMTGSPRPEGRFVIRLYPRASAFICG
jgi:hypothetical protein